MSGGDLTRREFVATTAAGVVAAAMPVSAARAAGRKGSSMKVKADYYQQFDADYTRSVPGEGYGGWQTADIELDRARTALVVMHAWDCGTLAEYPGWWRSVEYIPRSHEICRVVFPKLLGAARAAGLPVMHVIGGAYGHGYPGYQRAVKLAGPPPAPPERVAADASLQKLQAFRSEHVFVGPHNVADVQRGGARLGFPREAVPVGDEGVAENGHQLYALCREAGVNHLIYCGFAINWCLVMSPGGMHDMAGRGFMCSAIRQATTAVENKESAARELHKEEGLWRVAVAWGFVFDVDELVGAMKG